MTDNATPNTIDQNDRQNIRKHRKMRRRGAPHPRAGKPVNTVAFLPTGRFNVFRGENDEPILREELRAVEVRRNADWCAV